VIARASNKLKHRLARADLHEGWQILAARRAAG
jgi:hypothetical protein